MAVDARRSRSTAPQTPPVIPFVHSQADITVRYPRYSVMAYHRLMAYHRYRSRYRHRHRYRRSGTGTGTAPGKPAVFRGLKPRFVEILFQALTLIVP